MMVALGIALLVLLAPPAALAGDAECYVEFRGLPAPARQRLTQRACDGSCRFTLQVCINEPMPGCEPGPITGLRVKPAAGRMALALPAPGPSHACGEPTTVTLTPRRGRIARRVLRAGARASATGRRDRDRLILRCLPNAENVGCASPSTTPTTTTTSTTLPPLGQPVCDVRSPAVPHLGRQATFPPSIPTPGTCAFDGDASNYAMPEAELEPGAAEELHVIGVYRGELPPGVFRGWTGHPQGVIRVHVQARPKPVVLFLSAYEPVRWEIGVDPGAQLSRVIAQGHHDQEIDGPAGVPVIVRRPEETCRAYAYGWEVRHNDGGGSYEALIGEARQVIGLTETSFQGCSTGARFEVPYWTGDPPTASPPPVTGDEDVPREDVRFPGCESVTAESAYCLAMAEDPEDGEESPALLGLDTGRVCPIAGATARISSRDSHSIAWRGELMYVCGEDGLLRISLRDGSWEAPQVPCYGVAADAGRMFLTQDWPGRTVYAYDTYEAVLEGSPGGAYPLSLASRITVHAGRLLGAWHATDRIEVVDLATGAAGDPLLLEGYDDWVLGMSETPDGALVVSGATWGDTVYTFDAATGHRLCDVRPETPVRGLSCVSRRDTPRTCPTVTTTTTPTTTTTTTTPPGECSEPAVRCCAGMVPSGRCWEIHRDGTLALHDMCDTLGGTLTPGPCPDACGTPVGCCLEAGCPAFAFLGDEDPGFARAICQSFIGGTFLDAMPCTSSH